MNTRTYPTFPIPSVGAVILKDDHILLIQRGQAPAKGKWTLPGGVVEVGESPEKALIREVKEECSLRITVIGVIDVVNKVIRDDHNAIKYHYVIIDYLVCCQTDEPLNHISLQPGTDVTDVRWIPLQELTQYDLTEGLLRIIRAGIAMQKQWDQF
jgi:ADP-ribose pyrophosphatase YjhB (NUDIX family)